MEEILTEIELIKQFRDAKERLDAADLEAADAQRAYDELETLLIEVMISKDETKTGEVEGVGHITMRVPQLYASVLVDDKDRLLDYLRKVGRGDLIKETVHTGTLGTYVTECVDKGVVLPRFIGYYFKEKLLYYPDKKEGKHGRV